MNKVWLCGRLTKDPEVRYTAGENPTAIATYSLAVDRYKKKDGTSVTDFLPVKAFGPVAEFAGKYLRKGMKINVSGSIQQESYTTQEGQNRTYYNVVATEHEFCEKREAQAGSTAPQPDADGFINMEGDEALPFVF